MTPVWDWIELLPCALCISQGKLVQKEGFYLLFLLALSTPTPTL